jgi:tryptophan 6-halogenase
MNQRSDSDYWRDNASNDALSDNLKAIMTAWFTGADLAQDIARLDIGKYYSSLSWHCLLAGYGTFPPDHKLTASTEGLSLADMAKIDAFIVGCALNFGSHKEALANLSS